MAYTPTEWKTGDVITAPKLNNMENGIVNAGSGGSGGGIFLATITQQDVDAYTCDKTVAEINQAFTDGKLCLFVEPVPYAGGYNIYTPSRITSTEVYAQRTYFNVITDTLARVINTFVTYEAGAGSGGTDKMNVKIDTVDITIIK